MAYKINTVKGNYTMPTRDLLKEVYAAMEKGETEFEIAANGQHDIGGPLWSKNGDLLFKITNPGQRVGSMCMKGTTIVVEGAAPADVGWINSGGEIIVKGDSGDTTAHCASSGKIYIGGRVGTRSGSLMKHDPAYPVPELWVLKNTGSFSFEFMGGGIAVICGIDSKEFDSVLGDRACAGMVRGTIYVRGPIKNIDSSSVKILQLDDKDTNFLKENLPIFLNKIDASNHLNELLDFSQWQKIEAKSIEEKKKKGTVTIKDFHSKDWVNGGIFGDIYEDDGSVINMVNRGKYRLRIPEWLNAKFAAPCEARCPSGIPTQTRFNLIRQGRVDEALRLVLEYSPFPGSVCGGVCPNLCMQDCTRCDLDIPANIKGLGALSTEIMFPMTKEYTGKKVAIVGSGVGGLTAAWILRMRGHSVTVFEKDSNIGGKIVNAVSRERLSTKTIETEINRIKESGIEFKLNTNVEKKLYNQLKKDYDFVVLAIGAYQGKVPPWPGKEKISNHLDFLKQVNCGKRPKIGEKVVVIGCGNSGMDVVFAAYACGAKKVTAIDIQKPAAFQAEIEHAEKLGAEIKWPVYTKEITDKGLVLNDGTLIEADTVYAAIGEIPVLTDIIENPTIDRGYLKLGEDYKLEDNVYAIGDMTKLGLLTEAIGAGREVALRIHAALKGEGYVFKPRIRVPRPQLSLGYFSAVDTTDVPEQPKEDYLRCISCGTCRDCEMCKQSCPEKAIKRVIHNNDSTFEYVADPELCIGCGICAGVCPSGIWNMSDNA